MTNRDDLADLAVREGDRLLITQMHLSAPAPNEELVQTPLTV